MCWEKNYKEILLIEILYVYFKLEYKNYVLNSLIKNNEKNTIQINMNFEVSLGLLTSEPMSYVTHHDCGLLSIDKSS